jgi:quercetin dioxygenase-like cupin family protein
MSESTGHEYLKEHQISGDTLKLNLEDESRAVLDAARAANVGHAAKTLVKEGPLRLVILGFTAGASLQEHSATGTVSIQLLSGGVTISASGQSHSLAQGNVLVLGSAVTHDVHAETEAVLLLTLASPTP